MNINQEHNRINAILDNYRAQIDDIPDDKFDETPPRGGWSYAEVYSHILQATMASSIALERCTHESDKPNNGKVTLMGKLVLLFGRFPPVNIKVPQSVNAKFPATKISKEEARNLIIKCRKRMDEMAPFTNKKVAIRRVKHPRLGLFTAAHWFKFIRIHLAHHLKQLARIRKDFASN